MTRSAPVALFVYRRATHTRQTLEALAANHGAVDTDILIFADASRNGPEDCEVAAVRQLARAVTGFRSVRVIERETNLGLAKSIISGVTDVLRHHDRVIVVEDDLVTSPYFLSYMNEALERYEDDERVASIHGYVYPVQTPLPETFFLRGADCWGWATWRRGWALFDADGTRLLAELRRRDLLRDFDFDGAFDYTGMLEQQIAGRNDSWAVRWYASAYLKGRLTLYPGRSLVRNIGNDASGRHSAATDRFDVNVSATKIRVDPIPVEDSRTARQAFTEFCRSIGRRRSGRDVILGYLRALTGKA